MRQHKIAVLAALPLLCSVALSGCAQKIRLYEHRDGSWQPTTLCVDNNLTKLYIDGKLIEWDRSYDAWGVEIEIAPGSYQLEWTLELPERSWSYKGGGTLVVPKHSRWSRLYMRYAYRPKRPLPFRVGFDTLRRGSYSDVEVEAHFTWIEDPFGHNIFVGVKPLWAYW